MTNKERIIFEQGFEEGYAVARRNYDKRKEIIEGFKRRFTPEITDHLTCGNEKCFYDGKWCYHLTDKEFDKMIKFLESYSKL